jgi:hypothetical protein
MPVDSKVLTPGRGRKEGEEGFVDSKVMTPAKRSHENESKHERRAVAEVKATVCE